MTSSRPILITGAAGFIGFHLCHRLLADGWQVVGLDSMNEYYDVALKQARLDRLTAFTNFRFEHVDLADRDGISAVFAAAAPEIVVNLAAQAGVRYSLINPHAYAQSNLNGFLNILEGCRQASVGHLVYASSSSIYGGSLRMPFSVHDSADHPLSLYAASKKANELMAHTYSHLFGLPTTGLRFFTVYGPWGRPDMALFIFTKAILAGQPIDVFNHGNMQRDFTYIDDIVEGVVRIMWHPATPNPDWTSAAPDPATSNAPYRIHNIGDSSPVQLSRLIDVLEDALGRKAIRNLMPIQPGDVPATYADVTSLEEVTGFKPEIPIEIGIPRFVQWYRDFYQV
ncbi:NAD-dependent epimerase [Mesorhizobium sp. M2D.F.Ca.ET.185.01.1.1]|uniref:NAD-dependent epimerase n=1 Tax=unclassified Mesorhizobium TaxID=325217 RepID=UPI000FCC5843|nr:MULTISPECIES: NAD-dependent epimerase [unclassified Mesorhizobium]TGP51338.1 NAD-dependent epimerase [bacterium M00.F.Ca.ET.230.01.1.1]TGP73380.1 NAD-dependent epimerase [bacterium M00.F.Ca.ET.227.01.1.1]TGP84392.1 NAD-dependent epimerase [bacterium M00.F.Ca.ET.221.01.1.1]TGP87006.1 NAD-dependent epimerase [bacterium M00.F.Ca.ET.222.01.1.1]TGT72708.1 NAD-dependent epimerase [bacterium M00.F.Ca.ET.159.01.1.1]TGT85877.1 NAD-dependent epimerase [bacterium M00.F.Ca.ET.157.01.1.1]TGU22501.1 NA